MLRLAQYHTIPLPKGWPRRVRSAVIHVISLAHCSGPASPGGKGMSRWPFLLMHLSCSPAPMS
jgi:hypothetical protein